MQPSPKKVVIGAKARQDNIDGAEVVYSAVSQTFGARSNNVAIKRPFGAPAVVHDGVTVAQNLLPLEDEHLNIGAELVVEAAKKANNTAGDGTTLATILTREIAKGAHTYITAGSKPMALREGIEEASRAVVAELEAMAKPIESDDQKQNIENVRQIATISAQVEDIGKMVADAYEELGAEGIMTVEESRSTDSFLELKKGMEFDRGWRSPYFVNDQKHNEATIESPYIIVTDQKLRAGIDIAPFLEKLYKEHNVKDLVIIADDIDGEALGFLVLNHVKQNIRVVAINAPGFGDKRLDLLEDICTVTGATLISENKGLTFNNAGVDQLGRAARVVAGRDTTLIVEGQGAAEDIEIRIAQIREKSQMPEVGEFEREKLLERLAKMSSGVAVLNIGAKSEPELKERKERAIDAISAAKAALSEGIIPGGGMAMIAASFKASQVLKKHPKYNERDFYNGVQLVIETCRAPFNKLMENAGFDPGEKYAEVAAEPFGFGVDVTDGKVKDFHEAGIIDPVLVIKSSLENATSSAVMIATTNVNIIEHKPEPIQVKQS